MAKILYIENDENIRKDIMEKLRHAGFSVSGAANGHDALIKIEETGFDLILSELSLSDINGLNILEGYKIRIGSVPPPFIYISKLKDKKNIRRAMEAGADDYLTKPIIWQELITTIHVQLAKRKEILSIGESELVELRGAIENLSKIAVDKERPAAYSYDDSVFFSTTDKSQFIFLRDIVYIQSNGDYSRIFMNNDKSWLIKNSIKSWNSILPSNHFIQIRRSIIINVNTIQSMQKWFNYTHKIILKNVAEPFIMSQRYSRKLKNVFNKKKYSFIEAPESIKEEG